MMAFRRLIFACALCACTPLSTEGIKSLPDGLISMSFTGVQEGGSEATKTSLGSDFSIHWSSSDEVTIFARTGEAGETFKVASTESDGTVATFTGLSHESANGYYYALYPASTASRLVSTSGTLLASLPTVQTGVQDSYDPAAALSVARVDTEAADANNILHFKNAGALLSFLVPGDWVTKVRIESRDGSVAMTGPANISYNAGAPTVSATTSSKNYVEVSVPQKSIGKRFYASVYPGNYSKGFIVTFFTDQMYNRYYSSKALELKRNSIVRLVEKNWAVVNDRPQNESGTELIAPVIASGGQVSSTSAKISFSCGSGKRDTYKLYIRDAASMGEGTQVGTLDTGSGQYGSFSYTFEGLVTGRTYDLGVSAACTGEAGYGDSPITWLEDITINAAVSNMSVSIDSAAANYYNFVVNYKISGLSSTAAEHGIIFSYTNSAPTCGAVGADGKLPGPVIGSTGTVQFSQCIPNAPLRVGQPCYLRAYCFDNAAGNYVYSPVQTLTLTEQPSALSVSKTALSSPSSLVTISSITAGGSYKGYCAEAVCSASSGIRLGVNNNPMGRASAVSLASQLSSSGALVLINGQIFGSQGNIGLSYTGGALRYNNSSDDGISACRGYSNTYTTTWQPITRAILGVDASGEPGAYWCSLIGGTPYFFDRPIPAGSAVYPQVSASAGPGPKRNWTPVEALSTGPMLLYDGKVCVSEDKIRTGVYYTNYELWETTSGNIYGSSRQRTAIGYNSATGKVYLVAISSNITLTNLARLMKGLGCNYAMNLDGGLSTQMQVRGTGKLITSYSSRDVKSSIGFFER
ncbi:MAG: phosphodiester glycosidase family protein [Bacteroidales bacterium]|nr:phosphodiester glycosidase family protein [Bacteroidales bacterium]